MIFDVPEHWILVSSTGQATNGPYESAEEAETIRSAMVFPTFWTVVKLVQKREALLRFGDPVRRAPLVYDPKFGDDKKCQRPECGHTYERHFDWSEDYYPNCKYCRCEGFQ